jgi:ABC-2 type transport system ATP-binding protein
MIAVQGIGKRFAQPGKGQVWVLHAVDLTVGTGTILGLLGPNGAGKTTLIKILAGLLRPDSGSGTVLGYDLLRQHTSIRGNVSLVAPTADVGIDNNLTVRQNLAFWAPIFGLYGAQARQRIDDLLEQLGLADKADFWPMHISAGQRQRVALARSLLARTPLLFLDEPTNKLDIEGVRSVREMISNLNRTHGVTIILTTHVMEEAEELCGEIALLREGALITHQPTAQLTQSLQVARPITVTFRTETPAHDVVTRPLPVTPAVTTARLVPTDEPAHYQLTVESCDIRSTTPVVLAWVKAQGFALVSMQVDPVTLTDVFRALAEQRLPAQGLAMSGEVAG